MIAHIRKSDKIEQSVYEHCENVAELSSCVAETVGLSETARLCGMLHDEGKLKTLFTEENRDDVVLLNRQKKIPAKSKDCAQH